MKRLMLSFALTLSAMASAVTPFKLQWMNHATPGTLYESTQHSNGVFVVEAYFLGCPHCNNNAPNVNDLAESFVNEPRVQVLDVGIDRSDSQYLTWIKKHNPNHPVLKDAQRTLISQLGTSGYPSTYVIDCQGAVKYQTSGEWSPSTTRAIKTAVTELLKRPCPHPLD